MIEVKRVEIRDRATMMPAIALRITGDPNDPLLQRAGYGSGGHVILIDIVGMRCQHDPYGWDTTARTLPVAHRWLESHWPRQHDGAVLDVEFIEGERDSPKVSEIGRIA